VFTFAAALTGTVFQGMLKVEKVQKIFKNICKFRKDVYLCSRLRKEGCLRKEI